MLLLCKKMPLPLPLPRQGGASSQGGFASLGSSSSCSGSHGCWGTHRLWMGTNAAGPTLDTSPWVLQRPGVWLQIAQGCSRFGCKTWASASPFGSRIFMTGLPSDERQIIHPVIAHSNLDLGLSQVREFSLTEPRLPCVRALMEVLEIVSSLDSFAL